MKAGEGEAAGPSLLLRLLFSFISSNLAPRRVPSDAASDGDEGVLLPATHSSSLNKRNQN